MTIIDKIINADARYKEVYEIQRRATSLDQALNITECNFISDYAYIIKHPQTNFWFMNICG